MNIDIRQFSRNNPFLPMITSMLEATKDDPTERLLEELNTVYQTREREADAAQSQLQQAQQAPLPEVDRGQAFARRLGGGVAGVLQRSNLPAQQAEQDIQTKRSGLIQQREENLNMLATSYQRAAQRAEKLGDMELQLKYQTQAEKAMKDRQALLELGVKAGQHESEMQQIGLRNKGEKEAAAIRGAATKDPSMTSGQYRISLDNMNKEIGLIKRNATMAPEDKVEALQEQFNNMRQSILGFGRLAHEDKPLKTFARLTTGAGPNAVRTTQKRGWGPVTWDVEDFSLEGSKALFEPEEAAKYTIIMHGIEGDEAAVVKFLKAAQTAGSLDAQSALNILNLLFPE